MSSSKKALASTSAKKASQQPVDALNLPLPPVTLDFAIRGDSHRDGFNQRYIRKGDIHTAEPAMVGKGGFGTAYRFVRDDSFTPPASMMDATANSGEVDMSAENLRRTSWHPCGQTPGAAIDKIATGDGVSHASTSPAAASMPPEGPLPESPGQLRAKYNASPLRQTVSCTSNQNQRGFLAPRSPCASMPPSPTRWASSAAASGSRPAAPRNRAPAVVVVKVCRTPTSGSYDELPKTGIGRAEAKVAAQEIAAGNPVGEHTRIVRGEARLLRFLQMCHALRRKKSAQSHVVRLLADIPLPKYRGNTGTGRGDEDDEEMVDDEQDSYSGPPVPRLLIFERLVELDAELTQRGWAKTKRAWTIEKVELVAKDAIAGLAFLHEHNIVHGDLKPSNFMRDARTGSIKLIDLGASRRWVRLHNVAKERTTAVEELDQAVRDGHIRPPQPGEILCEGLGSLTGSPHFMAPEVLLQAGRYLSQDGLARNVLDDYVANRSQLPDVPSASLLDAAHRDFKRGWGIQADVWSWGCSMLSLLLRTMESSERPSSNSVCAFDFSFEPDDDALVPLWPLHASNDSLPRFHQWARLYPLRIMATVTEGVKLPEFCSTLSPSYLHMLQAAFQLTDTRPSAHKIVQYLESDVSYNVEYMSDIDYEFEPDPTYSRPISRSHSIARSAVSASSVGVSLPDEPHNIDLTTTSALSHMSLNGGGTEMQRQPSDQSLVNNHKMQQQSGSDGSMAPHTKSTQQKYLQSRLLHSSLGSPATSSPRLPSNLSSQHLGLPNEMCNKSKPITRQTSLLALSPQGPEQLIPENADQEEDESLDTSPAVPLPYGSELAAEHFENGDNEIENRQLHMADHPLVTEASGPTERTTRSRRSTVTPASVGSQSVSAGTAAAKVENVPIPMKQRRGSIFARMASSLSLRPSAGKDVEALPGNGQAVESSDVSRQGSILGPDHVNDQNGEMEELASHEPKDGDEIHGRGRSTTLRGLQKRWSSGVALKAGGASGGQSWNTSNAIDGTRRFSVLQGRRPSTQSLRSKLSRKAPLGRVGAQIPQLGGNKSNASLGGGDFASSTKDEKSDGRRAATTRSASTLGVCREADAAQSSEMVHAERLLNILGLDLGAKIQNDKTNGAGGGGGGGRGRRNTALSVADPYGHETAEGIAHAPVPDVSLLPQCESVAYTVGQGRPAAAFLQSDPYARRAFGTGSGGHGKGRSLPADAVADGADEDNGAAADVHSTRRQRSWSTFFKRKKHGGGV